MIFSDWPWRHWRQVRGEAIALRLNDEQLNWRELCARVDELASGFAAQGVVEGSGVMLRAWNTPQTLLAWLALLQCGARVLPVNPQLPQPLLEELLPNLTLQFALVPDGENTFPALTSLHIQRVEGAHAATWQPTRLCSMTLTSGSTGLPKAAVHTYHDIREEQQLRDAERDKPHHPVPEYCGTGLVYGDHYCAEQERRERDRGRHRPEPVRI